MTDAVEFSFQQQRLSRMVGAGDRAGEEETHESALWPDGVRATWGRLMGDGLRDGADLYYFTCIYLVPYWSGEGTRAGAYTSPRGSGYPPLKINNGRGSRKPGDITSFV